MLRWVVAAAVAMLASASSAADLNELRKLQAPPPVVVPPLSTDAKANALRLSKVVLQPREGEGWALVYNSMIINRGDDSPPDTIVPWEQGRMEADTAGFSRVFDEELRAAGFKPPEESSLFEEAAATDLNVGVLIHDMRGRFCMDCPNIFQRDKVAAVVTMNARWEVYSTLRSAVVARVTTNTGVTWRKAPTGSATPVIYDAFRENVRALIASEAFRQAVAGSSAASPPAPSLTPLAYTAAPAAKRTVGSSADAVAAIFAGDGMGSGFLISSEGYLLTNHHVVAGAKYVKVRWSDRSETVGEVIRSERRRDVAIVKVDAGGRRPLALSHADASLGDTVYVIGTPLDPKLQGTVTKGIVSGRPDFEGLSFIQSDATTNHGNSGGPLLNENGAVIGIAAEIYEISGAPAGLNFFIPIEDALKILALKPAA